MQKIITLKYPKCNNNHRFHKFGKDKFGNQKYRCLECKHQFAPDYKLKQGKTKTNKYPPCPVCGKATFLHHDYRDYSNFRCSDKRCNHSFFIPKPTAALPPSISNLFGKKDLKRMRHSPFLIITVLYQFFIGKSSTRNISLMLFQLYNIKLSHVTIADWCKKFALIFHSISLSLMPMMNFNSDEWHADETIIKINGKKHYVWFIIDSETRFVLGFHLSPHRNSPQAISLLSYAANIGEPSAIVSDRYYAYNVPVKSFFPNSNTFVFKVFKMILLTISLNLLITVLKLGIKLNVVSILLSLLMLLFLFLSSFLTSLDFMLVSMGFNVVNLRQHYPIIIYLHEYKTHL